MKILCKIHNGIKNVLLSTEKISNVILALPIAWIVVSIALYFFNFATGIFFIDGYLTTFFISSIIYCGVYITLLKLKNNKYIRNYIECIACLLFLITVIYFLILSPILIVAYALLYFYSKKQDDDPFEVIDSIIYIQIILAYFVLIYFILVSQVKIQNYFAKYFIVDLMVFIVSFFVKFLYRKFKLKNAKSLYLDNFHLFLMLSILLFMFLYSNICKFKYYNEFNNACSALSLFITAITKKYD